MKRLLLFHSTLLVSLLVAAATTVVACDCVTLSPSESFQNADIVFEGEVVRIAEADDGTYYTFKVDKLLKGTSLNEVVIFEGASNCDSHFWPDVVYRVHASNYNGKFSSGVCSGNEALRTKVRSQPQPQRANVSVGVTRYIKVAAIICVAGVLCLLIWYLPGSHRHDAA